MEQDNKTEVDMLDKSTSTYPIFYVDLGLVDFDLSHFLCRRFGRGLLSIDLHSETDCKIALPSEEPFQKGRVIMLWNL